MNPYSAYSKQITIVFGRYSEFVVALMSPNWKQSPFSLVFLHSFDNISIPPSPWTDPIKTIYISIQTTSRIFNLSRQ